MFIVQLLPKNFPEMNMFQQIDSLIDVYKISIKLSGNIKFKENIKMLKMIKNEFLNQNKSINIFELIGHEFTKEDFHRMKMNF